MCVVPLSDVANRRNVWAAFTGVLCVPWPGMYGSQREYIGFKGRFFSRMGDLHDHKKLVEFQEK